MHKFEKVLEKKMKDKKSHLGENESKAKMSVLQDLKDSMADMMKDRLDGGLKKVTVASDSKEGIKKGLEKAKQLMNGDMSPAAAEHAGKMEDEEEEGAEHEASESEAEESAEHDEGMEPKEEEEMSEAELDAKIKKLMAMKEKMKKEQEEA